MTYCILWLVSLAGVSRSVTVTAAYMMTVTNYGWRDCLNAIRGARSYANPNFGFQRQLQNFGVEKLTAVIRLKNLMILLVKILQQKWDFKILVFDFQNKISMIFAVLIFSNLPPWVRWMLHVYWSFLHIALLLGTRES